MTSKDFGILALEIYFPRFYIQQADLEVADGCEGKYTQGLGQNSLGFCSVEEDINSISLNVVNRLVERTNLDLRKVGFLEVGTETLIDKSKSTKTVIMQLFESCGNFDVEGIDVKNACFGGTAALFHALNWLESSNWDGRLALVVAADIAVYGSKAARPTGGAGAAAILLGPNAPLVIEPGLRAICMKHRYDFYKPDLSSEYPVVDGQLSVKCYREALESCYDLYKCKSAAKGYQRSISSNIGQNQLELGNSIDYMCFHTPYCRLVEKCFSWLVLSDVRSLVIQTQSLCEFNSTTKINDPECISSDSNFEILTNETPTITVDSSIFDRLKDHCIESKLSARDLDNFCIQATTDLFKQKVAAGLTFAKYVGNMYTASLYSCLASLLLNIPEINLRGRRILMYSYGSGLAAAMFSIRVHPDRTLYKVLGPNIVDCPGGDSSKSKHPLLKRLFDERVQVEVTKFEKLLEERREFHNSASFSPVHRPEGLFPGSCYLKHIDGQYRRFYEKMPEPNWYR